MQKKNNLTFFLIIISAVYANSMPFLGGYYLTDNYFDKNSFNTSQMFYFYTDNKFSDYAKFYSRIGTGFKYTASYGSKNDSGTWVFPNNGEYKNFSVTIPNIELLYFEFKTNKQSVEELNTKNASGETNFDLFFFRFGRVRINQGSGLVLNYNGDGLDTSFTIKNFRFRLFAVTNSFDYLPFFDFSDSMTKVTFTNWDKKRIPVLTNYLIDGNDNGLIGNIETSDYNFYFNYSNSSDYSVSEKSRLNSLRKAAIVAGRIFTGFTFEVMQIYFQNFSLNFLANIDLVPPDFVITYPAMLNQVYNTFGGKYSSFYISFNANGKIFKGLFYNFEGVYETGYNATYQIGTDKIVYQNALINSFAVNTGLTYYFDSKLKPTAGAGFMFAFGDDDADFMNGTVVNKTGQDNNYKSPTSPSIGYVVAPDFSNLMVISLNGSIKPFNYMKNEIFSRFSVETALLLLLRPIIKGAAFLAEKTEYLKNQSKYESYEKVFLGTEIDINALWQIFSDLSVTLKTGVLIPNYLIYRNSDIFWKVGIGLNISL